MRTEIVEKTESFIRQELSKLAGYRDNIPRMAEYRIEHSYRVAHLCAEIAEKEGFDAERACVAGLLHDIGYSVDMRTREDYKAHGRTGAAIARPFLLSLGYSAEETNEMCYGIAIHVDDVAGFEGERTPLALTVQDADNIDRFDAFRLYESLAVADYRNLSLADQLAFTEKNLTGLARLRDVPCGTATAQAMWQEKIDYQLGFFRRLRQQIEKSR